MGWRNDIRLEIMAEGEQVKRECSRCGVTLWYRKADDPTNPAAVICAQCLFDDWHEEYPEVLPEEDCDAS